MDVLIKIWRSTFYLWPAILFVTFFLSILFFYPNKRYRNIALPIKLYTLSFCICLITIDLTVLINNNYTQPIKNLYTYADYLLTIIEFILVNYYFYSLSNNTWHKKVLLYLSILFFLVAFVLSFQLPTQHAVVKLYTTQVFLLLIPTLFYFKVLLKNNSGANISKDPSFWISSGIAFFLLCTMILSVIETFFLNHRPDILSKLYPTYHIFYILMFLMFLRAYMCKPVSTRL